MTKVQYELSKSPNVMTKRAHVIQFGLNVIKQSQYETTKAPNVLENDHNISISLT